MLRKTDVPNKLGACRRIQAMQVNRYPALALSVGEQMDGTHTKPRQQSDTTAATSITTLCSPHEYRRVLEECQHYSQVLHTNHMRHQQGKRLKFHPSQLF